MNETYFRRGGAETECVRHSMNRMIAPVQNQVVQCGPRRALHRTHVCVAELMLRADSETPELSLPIEDGGTKRGADQIAALGDIVEAMRELIAIELDLVVKDKSEFTTFERIGGDRLKIKACPVALTPAACQNNISAGALEGVRGNDLWTAQVWTQDSWQSFVCQACLLPLVCARMSIFRRVAVPQTLLLRCFVETARSAVSGSWVDNEAPPSRAQVSQCTDAYPNRGHERRVGVTPKPASG